MRTRARLHPVLESQVRGTIRRWRWIRFWRDLGILSTAVWAGALLVGVSAWKGWVSRAVVVFPAIGLLVLAGAGGLVLLAVVAAAVPRTRSWAARALEAFNPALLDRLNTLAFLEPRREEEDVAPYFRRIEAQARDAVPWALASAPFSWRPAWIAWGAWAVVCAATVTFYVRTEPLDRVTYAMEQPAEEPEVLSPDMPGPEMARPAAAAKPEKAWGEVRITEPGRDLQVTKVDVVPLQIEAASSDELSAASWLSAVGGARPSPHPLPSPAEPHYAAYKPLVYVDEFRLSDWDVLSYYASASTRAGASYASEIYFLEVRPFREDILKATGGEGTPRYRLLGELSALIERQKHVLRETHRHLQAPYDRPERRRQDRDKLASAEQELGQASRHLYARIAAEMENTDVGVVLDQLARASEALDAASGTLRGEAPPVPPEQSALAELVLTRKTFQKALSSGGEGEGAPAEPEEAITAELTDKLKEVAEFRNEQKAVEERLDELRARQKRLAEKARAAASTERPGLAPQEEAIARDLAELSSAHPRAWKGAEKEDARADESLAGAAKALAEGKEDAAKQAESAAAALDALDAAVGRRADAQGLADAYRLKEMLDAQARALGRVEERPEGVPRQDAARTAAAARDTTRELKKLVEETPAGGAFGPPLHEALGPGPQGSREEALEAVARAERPEERRRAASASRRALEQLSQAFDKSTASAGQAGAGDPLRASGSEAMALALRQLESLAAAAAGGREPSPEDREKQRREALANLHAGLEAVQGKDPRAADLLVRVDQELKGGKVRVDAARLRELLAQIERFRVEMSGPGPGRPNDTRARHVDPAHLPAAYRDRIQKYFQQLSEEDPP